MAEKTYPRGTTFGNYYICRERIHGEGKLLIRRHVKLPDGTMSYPRYPARRYEDLASESELVQLVDRLNYRENAIQKKNIQFRTAFIPAQLMEDFRDHLRINIPNQKDFLYSYNTLLKRYFLGFFIGCLEIYDPVQWIKHQEKWAAALLSKADSVEHNLFDKEVSAKTIRHVVQMANRFMTFLHQKMPDEYPPVVFEPLSVGAIKNYSAEQTMGRDAQVGKFITDDHWRIIQENLPSMIHPFIQLMYHYGLRRSESLGFDSTKSVKEGFLKIEKQVKSFPDGGACYTPLKDRELRKTPHWFCEPIKTFNWITQGQTGKMHPDTLSTRWDRLMLSLGFDYKLHDLRRTFITRALRIQSPRDVQLAVGHASLTTTMAYARDDRELGERDFIPRRTA